MSSELVKRDESQALERHEPTVMEIIDRLATNPSMEAVAVIERMVALKNQQEERHARQVFASAMAKLQARLPQIDKEGQAKNSKFAKLENVDVIVRPLLAEFGFSLSFDEESHTDKTVTFVAVMSHEDGHSESKRLTVPIDAASKNREGVSIRPAIQDAGSTVSYARRYLLKMHLNIIEKDEDTNGESKKKIAPEQAATMKAKIDEVGTINMAKFLAYMGNVESIADILQADEKKAWAAIADAERLKSRSQAAKK